jgi:hypothetical protein
MVNYALECRRNHRSASSRSATGRHALSCRQLLKQRLRLFQIARVEPFSKPAVNRACHLSQCCCLLICLGALWH